MEEAPQSKDQQVSTFSRAEQTALTVIFTTDYKKIQMHFQKEFGVTLSL